MALASNAAAASTSENVDNGFTLSELTLLLFTLKFVNYRLPDNKLEVLYFTQRACLTSKTLLRKRPSRACQTYIRGLERGRTGESDPDITSILPLIVHGLKVRNLASIFYPVAFHALWFGNRATYQKSKICIGSANDWPKYRLKNVAHPGGK